jgi:cytochrome c oxidase assembly factor CtaG
MDPTLSVLLLSWSWRPAILLTLGLAAAIHLVGRWRLKKRGSVHLVNPWRSVAYLTGLVVLGIALMSPIDTLSAQFLYMHMIQHLLLVMIAAPLLWLADPMPIMMWGLPRNLRTEVGRWLRPDASFRKVVRSLTKPGLVWLYFVAFLVGWHDPNAYVAALQYELIHDLEHITFFATAMLFWWHVIGSAPHIHRQLSPGLRIGYALSVVPATALTGIAIALSSKPIYDYYANVPRLGSMTVMEDQMLGGVIMWIPGSMMYIVAALILLAQLIQKEEEKEPLIVPGAYTPREAATDESFRAPGFEEPNSPSTFIEDVP